MKCFVLIINEIKLHLHSISSYCFLIKKKIDFDGLQFHSKKLTETLCCEVNQSCLPLDQLFINTKRISILTGPRLSFIQI